MRVRTDLGLLLGRALGVALALALAAPGAASAHARLVRASPEDGAVLGAAPREIRLWFDEPVAATFSAAELLDAQGRTIGAVALRPAADPNLLIADLPPVGAGLYSLAWKVYSEIDSHTTRGTLVFGVNQAVTGVGQPAEAPEPAPPLAEVALRAALYISLAVVIGAWLAAGLIMRPRAFEAAAGPLVRAARSRLLRLGVIGAGCALLAGALSLAWQTASLERGTLLDLLQARFGFLWLAQQGLLGISALALVAARRGLAWGWWSAGLAVALLAGTLALNSHAASAPQATAWAVGAQAAHALFAGAWVGTLLALVATLAPWLLSQEGAERSVALAGWRRFGGLATLSVGALAATGLYNTARQVASLDAWVSTAYGRTLALKLGLFVVVGLAGLINALLLHPGLAGMLAALLRRPADWRPVSARRQPFILLAEAGLGLAVLALTGWLTATPPARGAEYLAGSASVRLPASRSLPADDLVLNLQIRPNKPGPNIITVGVFNTRRPAPAEVLRVLVRITFADQGLGTQTLVAEPAGADQYRINTSAFSLAGAWRVQVVARRRGLPDAVADFDWQLEPLALSRPAQPVWLSPAPLAPALTGLAAGVLTATALAGLIMIGRRRAKRPGGLAFSPPDQSAAGGVEVG